MEDIKQTDTPITEPVTLEEWQAKAAEYLQGWKRAIADYQNREKELATEKRAVAQYAVTGVVDAMLPVLDNLQSAFTHIPEEQRSLGWVQGITHIIRQFQDVLKQFGVTPFASVGLPFDPTRHDAVGEEAGEAGIVLREVAAGYEQNGNLLRVARVIVGK